MSCKCSTFNPDGRYQCSVSGDGCMFLTPNSKACAEKYGEGPDAIEIKLVTCQEIEDDVCQSHGLCHACPAYEWTMQEVERAEKEIENWE